MFSPFILLIVFQFLLLTIANGKIILFDLANILFSKIFFFKKDAPRLVEFKNFYTQPVNSRFILTCSKMDGAAPLKFIWTKNGHSISQTSDSRIKIDLDDDFSMITIKNIQIDDAGNYSCIVQNRYGIDSQWSMLQVKGWSVDLNTSLDSEQNVALNFVQYFIFSVFSISFIALPRILLSICVFDLFFKIFV